MLAMLRHRLLAPARMSILWCWMQPLDMRWDYSTTCLHHLSWKQLQGQGKGCKHMHGAQIANQFPLDLS